jgi:hypothetical protein
LELYTDPADGDVPIVGLIGGAHRSVDLTMYELTDRSVEAALVAAHRRGVHVRVLLDDRDAGSTVNRAAYLRLTAAGVPVRWGSGDVIFHQKTLTADGEASAIMTGNLTDDEADTRDFAVIDHDRAAVSAITTVFDADWDGAPVAAGPDVDGLVWSPGSMSPLLALIDSAHHSLVVENEEMDSPPIESALESASRRGVAVELVMTGIGELLDLEPRRQPGARSDHFGLEDRAPAAGNLDVGLRRCSAMERRVRLKAQSADSMASAALTVRPGPGSTLSTVTTPFSINIAYRCERVPNPKPLPSISKPTAAVNSPFPSASITTVSPTCCASAHAPITKGSLTEMQAIVSTPPAFSSPLRTM